MNSQEKSEKEKIPTNSWFIWHKAWNSFSCHKLHNIPLILIIGFSLGFGVVFIDAQDMALVVQD